MSNQFSYNHYGREQTGFDNSIDHSTFGHWTNPEYQQMQQECEAIDRENAERAEKEPGHHCPYCGHVEMQINNHYAHIEFMHP